MNEGPINGKIGYALAAIRQFQPVILILFGTFVLFGFQFSTPGQQMILLTTRMKEVEESVDALVRLACIKETNSEIVLSGLPCKYRP